MTGMPLPHRLIAFYGDDFTGSTDVMEVVATAGLPAVLFLVPPDEAMLARFPEARVVGLAGVSRSQTPEWMGINLPPIYRALQATGAPFVHYKVCSTFDSAPHIGNIGAAAKLGMDIFANRPVPLAVGAPALRRYIAFGNLFAGIGETRYRIDRHPVMSRHPVTPMHEADLRIHLAAQADLTIGLADLVLLPKLDSSAGWQNQIAGQNDLLLFDTVDEDSLRRVGALLWSLARDEPSFAVGSSGFEYALVAAWRAAGLLPAAPSLPPPSPVERMFVLSGSCSPVTAGQIAHARNAGFAGFHLDPQALLGSGEAVAHAVGQAIGLLESGRDVLLYTAEGPADSLPASMSQAETMAFNDRLGAVLGEILRAVLVQSGLRRVVVAGGDTSSHATQQLGLFALTFAAPLAPGSPLCRGHSDIAGLDGTEIVLKGGQMGQEDFFLRAKGNAKT
jgi:3-oxoisoapionate kinase